MSFLSRLTGRSAGSSSRPHVSPAVSARIRSILRIRELEAMPIQAARAFQLASDHSTNTDQFVRILEGDEVLSARILRVANSVYFFRGSPAMDIERAVANIGLEELRALISSTMLRSLLHGPTVLREQVWANSIATAIGARSLSRWTKIPPSEAFLCGLLHDLGKLVMLRHAGTLYEQVVKKVGATACSFVDAEGEIFQVNHVEVGAWASEAWKFAENCTLAIAGHHDAWPKDPKARGKNISCAMLIKAADTVAHSLGIGHPPTFRAFKQQAQEELFAAFEQLGVGANEVPEIIKTFEEQFKQEHALYHPQELAK